MAYWGRDELEENSLEAHRDFMIAPDGTYGHPSINQGPRQASDGLIDRARAALTFSRGDGRFEMLMSRFARRMRY